MATPQTQNDPYRAQSRRSGTLLAVGGIMLALMGGFALGRGGVFGGFGQIGGRSQVADLSVPGQSSPVTIEAGGSGVQVPTQVGFDPVAPDLNVGAQPQGPTIQVGDKMPADVRAWLLHLEKTEQQRHQMTTTQLSSLMTQLTGLSGGALNDLTAEAYGEESTGQNYDPQKREALKGETEAKRTSWRSLNQFFNSKQPPAECVPIKNSYEQCLGETSAMMMDILAQLEKSQEDPQGAINALMGMMGTSAGKIDVAAKQSDGLVGQVCHKYDTYKWFSISGDIGGGLGLGLGGLGGMLGGG